MRTFLWNMRSNFKIYFLVFVLIFLLMGWIFMENQKRDMKNTNGGTPYEFYFKNDFCFLWFKLNSKKKYIKYSKSSKFYRRSQILNCLGFNNYRILVRKIYFHWRISMSVNTFPLEVFDFSVSLSGIINTLFTKAKSSKTNIFQICNLLLSV